MTNINFPLQPECFIRECDDHALVKDRLEVLNTTYLIVD
jgi:hypothetical protein